MYKTIYGISIKVNGQENPWNFAESIASTALNQIKACRDVDVYMQIEGVPQGIIIPYHAIEYVVVTTTRTEEEDPVDDNAKNCTESGGDGRTGTLTIINNTGHIINGPVFASAALSGTYGPLTFSTDSDEPFPTGYQSYAMITGLGAGSSLEVTGLPVGTTLECANNTATVPGELILMR